MNVRLFWNLFLVAALTVLLIQNDLQGRRIKELESKIAYCEATDEVFWRALGEVYRGAAKR